MTWFKNGINQKVSVQKQKHEAISKGHSKYQKKKNDRNKIKCINYNEYIKYSVKRKNFRLDFKNLTTCY